MRVDVVLVSYNSRDHLRASIEPLVAIDGVQVFVIDNASTDDGVATIADLPVSVVELAENRGFGAGCNTGWRLGAAPYVLFLNPDATLTASALDILVAVLDGDARVGLVAPKILESDGSLAFSQRRFPRLRSTYSRALFLHRLLPQARWTDEIVRDRAAYCAPGSPEWVSGACMLVRRTLLEELGGFDERFFMYCEDKDLCRRIRLAGYDVRFEPGAASRHRGGASAPRAGLLPVLAESRVQYARKHLGSTAAALERAGVALGALTHLLVTRHGRAARAGHARALGALTIGRPKRTTSRPGAPP